MHWLALLPTTTPDAADTASAQRALGWQALRFTPRVALQDEAVLLEVAASARLFGGLRALVQQLAALVDEENKPLASTEWAYGATSLVALGRLRVRVQTPQAGPVALRALPLSSLSAARDHLAVLERIGCRTWGDLQALPRGGVARRFGQPLLDALDQACGQQPESHAWLVLPEVFEDSLELGALVENAGALLFAARCLLARLRSWLVAQSGGLLALQLVWHFDTRRGVAEQGALVLRLSEPAQDMAHATRLLAEQLAHVTLPAPVHTLTLRSLDVVPLPAASRSLLVQERANGDSLAQLVERLSARLGPQAVRRWQPCASQVPERMQRGVAAQELLAHHRKAATNDQGLCEALLPSWLLEAPLPLEVRGNRPWYQGPLTLLAGPQRLESSGWLADAPALQRRPAMRDYFIARSESAGLLWIFQPRLGAQAGWYLHGIFA
ncbi:MAG TPA: DNA polymerase Y family protein [Burkholderiaceae bacterium]